MGANASERGRTVPTAPRTPPKDTDKDKDKDKDKDNPLTRIRGNALRAFAPQLSMK